MDLEKITFEVIELAKGVGDFIKSQSGSVSKEEIEIKGIHDFVTYVDKGAEVKLVEGLKSILPQAGFIAEEGTETEKGERFTWVVDPLDGTTNFLHNIPCYAISIALMDDEEIIIGIVYEVNMKECFYAWKGDKAYLNENQIKVSDKADLKDSLLITGFPNRDFARVDAYLKLFKHLMEETHGLRRFGSAAVDLAWVACGRGEAFYEYGLSPWDVAAGAFIVQQAGGRVCDFSGGDNYLFGTDIVATNGGIHEELVTAIGKYML